MLDEVMQAGLEPEKQHVVQFETRSLRDARQLLASVSLADATQFIEQNPHPRHVCLCITSMLDLHLDVPCWAQYSVLMPHISVERTLDMSACG